MINRFKKIAFALILRRPYGMAIVHKRQGNVDAALTEYRRVLDIQRKTLGDAHVDTVETLEAVMLIYEETGSSDEAEKLKAEMTALQVHEVAITAD